MVGVFESLANRLFPKAPDFYILLHEQAQQVTITVNNLTYYMQSQDEQAGELLQRDEHQADTIRIRNLQALNQAFATTIDREDIFRAIDAMDGIVTHSKNTFNEMEALKVKADHYCLAMVEQIQQGVRALEKGFAWLKQQPIEAQEQAMLARHCKRRIEKIHYQALAQLFVGDDYLHMFKMRELYRHLEHISLRLHTCANVLEDIVVKTT